MGRKSKAQIEQETNFHPNGMPKVPYVEPSLAPLPATRPQDEFDIRSTALETEIEKKYSPQMLDTFKRLSYEITVIGLQLQEACTIVGVEYEKLVVMMRDDPLVERMIRIKDLEYKRKLLKTVSTKAGTDDKIAMGLLQARYPNEFNPRKGAGPNDPDSSDDLLGMAIEFVQKSGDKSPLVTEKSAKITVVKRTKSENADVLKRIGEILK